MRTSSICEAKFFSSNVVQRNLVYIFLIILTFHWFKKRFKLADEKAFWSLHPSLVCLLSESTVQPEHITPVSSRSQFRPRKTKEGLVSSLIMATPSIYLSMSVSADLMIQILFGWPFIKSWGAIIFDVTKHLSREVFFL